MSIDAKIDELIGAINGLADSNRALATAYARMAGAPDNGPVRAPRGTGKATPTDTVTTATPAPAETKPTPEKTAAPEVTIADVREAVMGIGDRDEIHRFVTSFGVSKVSDLPPGKWADVIEKARAIAAGGNSPKDPLA